MFIFGWQAKHVGEKKLEIPCNTCNFPNLSLFCNQQVFDLYWIPTLPLRKSTTVGCTNCGTLFPTELYSDYITANDQSFKTPLKYYSGLIIIAGLALAAFLAKLF